MCDILAIGMAVNRGSNIIEKLNYKHTKDLAQQRQNPETVSLSASSSAGRGRG